MRNIIMRSDDLKQNRLSKSDMTNHFDVSRQTIAALYNNTQSVNDRPMSSRSRVTTAAQDRYMRVLYLQDRT